jgi:hypothetical protein
MEQDMDFQLKQRRNHDKLFLSIVDSLFLPAYERHRNRSAHSPEALYSLWQATKYVCRRKLRGDVVEFGTWRGGAAAVMAEALVAFGGSNHLVSFDTFKGYPKPSPDEVDVWGNSMLERWLKAEDEGRRWGSVCLEEVENHLAAITSRFTLVEGEVGSATDFSGIQEIALLRLDMNWFEPTLVALRNCFPKIVKGGVISVVSDHHSGSRDALNAFLDESNLCLNFQHVNYSNIICTVN